MNLQMAFAGEKLVRESSAADDELRRVKSIRSEATNGGNRNLQAIGFEQQLNCENRREPSPYI